MELVDRVKEKSKRRSEERTKQVEAERLNFVRERALAIQDILLPDAQAGRIKDEEGGLLCDMIAEGSDFKKFGKRGKVFSEAKSAHDGLNAEDGSREAHAIKLIHSMSAMLHMIHPGQRLNLSDVSVDEGNTDDLINRLNSIYETVSKEYIVTHLMGRYVDNRTNANLRIGEHTKSLLGSGGTKKGGAEYATAVASIQFAENKVERATKSIIEKVGQPSGWDNTDELYTSFIDRKSQHRHWLGNQPETANLDERIRVRANDVLNTPEYRSQAEARLKNELGRRYGNAVGNLYSDLPFDERLAILEKFVVSEQVVFGNSEVMRAALRTGDPNEVFDQYTSLRQAMLGKEMAMHDILSDLPIGVGLEKWEQPKVKIKKRIDNFWNSNRVADLRNFVRNTAFLNRFAGERSKFLAYEKTGGGGSHYERDPKVTDRVFALTVKHMEADIKPTRRGMERAEKTHRRQVKKQIAELGKLKELEAVRAFADKMVMFEERKQDSSGRIARIKKRFGITLNVAKDQAREIITRKSPASKKSQEGSQTETEAAGQMTKLGVLAKPLEYALAHYKDLKERVDDAALNFYRKYWDLRIKQSELNQVALRVGRRGKRTLQATRELANRDRQYNNALEDELRMQAYEEADQEYEDAVADIEERSRVNPNFRIFTAKLIGAVSAYKYETEALSRPIVLNDSGGQRGEGEAGVRGGGESWLDELMGYLAEPGSGIPSGSASRSGAVPPRAVSAPASPAGGSNAADGGPGATAETQAPTGPVAGSPPPNPAYRPLADDDEELPDRLFDYEPDSGLPAPTVENEQTIEGRIARMSDDEVLDEMLKLPTSKAEEEGGYGFYTNRQLLKMRMEEDQLRKVDGQYEKLGSTQVLEGEPTDLTDDQVLAELDKYPPTRDEKLMPETTKLLGSRRVLDIRKARVQKQLEDVYPEPAPGETEGMHPVDRLNLRITERERAYEELNRLTSAANPESASPPNSEFAPASRIEDVIAELPESEAEKNDPDWANSHTPAAILGERRKDEGKRMSISALPQSEMEKNQPDTTKYWNLDQILRERSEDDYIRRENERLEEYAEPEEEEGLSIYTINSMRRNKRDRASGVKKIDPDELFAALEPELSMARAPDSETNRPPESRESSQVESIPGELSETAKADILARVGRSESFWNITEAHPDVDPSDVIRLAGQQVGSVVGYISDIESRYNFNYKLLAQLFNKYADPSAEQNLSTYEIFNRRRGKFYDSLNI